MYKKLAIAAAATLVVGSAFAQSSVTLYGVFDTALVHSSYSDGKSTITGLNAGNQSGISGSRFGFKGSEDIGGGNHAVFTLEGGFNPQNGTSGQGGITFGRQAFVGLNGGWGSFTMGRQYNPGFSFYGNYDPLWGISNANETGFYLAYTGARANNSARYAYDGSGLHVEAMHAFGNIAGSTSAGQLNGILGTYGAGPFSVGAVYQSHDQNTTSTTNNGNATNIGIGGSYAFGPAKVLANFMSNKVAVSNNTGSDKSKLLTLGVNYDITPVVGLVAAYYRDNGNSASGLSGNRNTIGAGLTYSLSKRTMTYVYFDHSTEGSGYYNGVGADVGTGLGTTGTSSSGNNMMIGLRHAF